MKKEKATCNVIDPTTGKVCGEPGLIDGCCYDHAKMCTECQEPAHPDTKICARCQKYHATNLQALAKGLRCELFADRPTIKEAHEYASKIAKACGKEQEIYVLTALHVMMNTIANEIERVAGNERKLIAKLFEICEGEYPEDQWDIDYKPVREAQRFLKGVSHESGETETHNGNPDSNADC